MKKFQLNLLMCIIAGGFLLLSACEGDKEAPNVGDWIQLGKTTLTFDAHASTPTDPPAVQGVDVIATVLWEASTGDSWITIQPPLSYKGGFNIAVSVNTTNQERTGKVTVKGGSASAELTITQKAN